MARSSFDSLDNWAWLSWGSLLLPHLTKVVEAEEATVEHDEKIKQKEERRAAIMARFEADKITGDEAGVQLEKLDEEFGPGIEEPVLEESANDEEVVESDDNIPLDDDFKSRVGTQAR